MFMKVTVCVRVYMCVSGMMCMRVSTPFFRGHPILLRYELLYFCLELKLLRTDRHFSFILLCTLNNTINFVVVLYLFTLLRTRKALGE